MLRKFLQFLLQSDYAERIGSDNFTPPVSLTPTSPPTDDRTRPSYRVGRHKPEDVHKALDMGG